MRLAAFVVVVLLFPALATACGGQRWLEVEPGDYDQVRGVDHASRAAAREIEGLTVDREADVITVALDDGSELPLSFVSRAREAWLSGCPTNLFEHRMEVFDLDVDAVSIGDLTLQNPILARDCPAEPEEAVLCEEGSTPCGGGAVDGPCLVFGR